MRKALKESVTFRFTIKPPAAEGSTAKTKRTTFAIEQREIKAGKVLSSKTIKHATLTSINQAFLAKQVNRAQARASVAELVEQLYLEKKAFRAIVHNTANLQILEKYLEWRYPPNVRRKLADFDTARYECVRAVEAVGLISLLSASTAQIQDAVDNCSVGDPNKQRRIISKLNAILAFARPQERIRLSKDAEENKQPKYVTVEEFEKQLLPVMKAILPEHIVLAAEVCFYTGARIGEASAFTPADLRESRFEVFIAKQVTKENVKKNKTKNKKNRICLIFPEGIKAFKKWVEVKGKMTTSDRSRLAEHMRAACEKAFPGIAEKQLKFHDLRHSYAIRLLDKGLTTDYVAKQIGDSAQVCEKHYIGFIVSTVGMDIVRQKVLGKK